MLIRKAFQFQLRLNKTQEAFLRRWSGCCRFVWNRILAEQRARIERGEKVEGYAAFCRRLTELKKEFEWLGEVPSHTLQQTLKSLARAFKEARTVKGRKPPRFKKKGRTHDSLRFPVAPKVIGDRAKFPKIGFLRFRQSREIQGKIRNATISRRGAHWFVSFATERKIEEPKHSNPDTTLGIDLGVARFATMSDGSFCEPLDSFRALEKKLARLQRSASRKAVGSNNFKKAKRRIADLHIKIANARNDYLHRISYRVSKSHAMIAMEDLKVSNMSRSAKGTLEQPGKNVRAKSGLNKAILDQGWFEFRRQIEYKSRERGGLLILIDPKNTSRQCSSCGFTAKENRRTQAGFVCLRCGHESNADENAARNILERGLSAVGHTAVACGGPLGAR